MIDEMTYVKHSPPINLRQWGVFADMRTSERFIEKVTAAIQESFEQYPPHMFLPLQYGPDDDGLGGPVPGDPVMLYVRFPLGRYADEGPCYAISLEAVVDDLLTFLPERESGVGEKLSVRLRMLADKIDARCAQVAEKRKAMDDAEAARATEGAAR